MDEKEDITEKGYDNEKGLFHIDNPLSTGLTKLGSLILANILFIACSIPVITIGASLTALIKVCWKLQEERDVKITGLFFRTFAQNVLDSTICWLMGAGLLGGSVFAGYNALNTIEGNLKILVAALCGIVAITTLVMLTYSFVLIGRYNNSLVNQLKNAVRIGFAKLLWSVLIWAFWALPIAAFVMVDDLLMYLGWVWLLIGFAALESASCRVYRKVLMDLEKKEGN